jgi:hypothetical protein
MLDTTHYHKCHHHHNARAITLTESTTILQSKHITHTHILRPQSLGMAEEERLKPKENNSTSLVPLLAVLTLQTLLSLQL